MDFKVGDKIRRLPYHQCNLWKRDFSDPVVTVQRVRGIDVWLEENPRFSWCSVYFELVQQEDPIDKAKREVAEAHKRVVEAEKKLADLLDPPVAVGQKRKAGFYVHEILFIDEQTGSAMTRFFDPKTPQNGHPAVHTVTALKSWPIVP